jgi:hypothetical protein
MIKVVFLVAVIAVVGSQAPAAFGSFNKAGVLVLRVAGPWTQHPSLLQGISSAQATPM